MGETAEERLRSYFSNGVPGVLVVYLFGSEALGTSGPSSDVDVAVLYDENPPATLESPAFALEAELERLLGRPVQVIP